MQLNEVKSEILKIENETMLDLNSINVTSPIFLNNQISKLLELLKYEDFDMDLITAPTHLKMAHAYIKSLIEIYQGWVSDTIKYKKWD